MLDRTYRFHDKLADFSSRFVQKNPSQIRKQLTTSATSNEPGVVIWMTDEQHDPLDTILTEIAAQGSASVFILSRYRHGIPSDLNFLKRRFPNLTLKAMTAHASKGLEADYVVINHLKSGKYGFPSETASDPVLALVQAESEQFEFAEERRLFYVALTRAKVRASDRGRDQHVGVYQRDH
jgi:DNA helicase-4